MIEAWSDEMGDRCDCRASALCGRCLLGGGISTTDTFSM
jgi:hypothetical protein